MRFSNASVVVIGLRSPKLSGFHGSQLYSLAETPQPPPPPHLGSYRRTPLVSQDRRHLLWTPGSWYMKKYVLCGCSTLYNWHKKCIKGLFTAAYLKTGKKPFHFLFNQHWLVICILSLNPLFCSCPARLSWPANPAQKTSKNQSYSLKLPFSGYAAGSYFSVVFDLLSLAAGCRGRCEDCCFFYPAPYNPYTCYWKKKCKCRW